jgi:hypothetical protein
VDPKSSGAVSFQDRLFAAAQDDTDPLCTWVIFATGLSRPILFKAVAQSVDVAK